MLNYGPSSYYDVMIIHFVIENMVSVQPETKSKSQLLLAALQCVNTCSWHSSVLGQILHDRRILLKNFPPFILLFMNSLDGIILCKYLKCTSWYLPWACAGIPVATLSQGRIPGYPSDCRHEVVYSFFLLILDTYMLLSILFWLCLKLSNFVAWFYTIWVFDP